jgi:hypothetical protein
MNRTKQLTIDKRHFPIQHSDLEPYQQMVRTGFRSMAASTVTIAGLARSVAHIMPKTIERIEELGGHFRNYRVIVYENDSADETLSILTNWSKRNPRVRIISENLNAPVSQPIRCLSRADRMVYYRSRLQEEILSRSTTDYVVLVDTDLVGGWSLDGIATTFSRNDWDFVGSNGLIYKRNGLHANATIQYDAWAYRNRGDDTPLSTRYVNKLRYAKGGEWVLLNSCFGGLGIYTTESYSKGKYTGGDIEHVTFHRSMREQGFDRIYLNPSQIVLYGRKVRRLDRIFKTIHTMIERVPFLGVQPWQFEHDSDASKPIMCSTSNAHQDLQRRSA